MDDKIYPTDDKNEILRRINSRSKIYTSDLSKDWKNLKAKIFNTDEGEEVLQINGLEVMASFEKPYMKRLAEIVVENGGDILNVGFGLGIADNFIEQQRISKNIREHHIIELNKDVYSRAKKWRLNQESKDNIYLHLGNWNDIIGKIDLIFDGILYDAFPLKQDELCRDIVPFLAEIIKHRLIRQDGTVTFYLDSTQGFGKDFRTYLRKLGISKFEFDKVLIDLPKKRKPQGWEENFFLAPKLTGFSFNSIV